MELPLIRIGELLGFWLVLADGCIVFAFPLRFVPGHHYVMSVDDRVCEAFLLFHFGRLLAVPLFGS